MSLTTMLSRTSRRFPAPDALLDQVDNWLFDMDNSLYPASANLFGQIDKQMEAYVGKLLGLDSTGAREVQKRYFHDHGTTLRGLMLHHGTDPHDFLDFVHDIDFSVLTPDPLLAEMLHRLPGRCFVFTNGDKAYAERVLSQIGILDAFEDIHDIHAMDYYPKPEVRSYKQVVERFSLAAERTFFADDMAHNLQPAHGLGMATLWVNNGSERGDHGHSPDFIDFETDHLTDWLESLGI